jgi:hypothetical protein
MSSEAFCEAKSRYPTGCCGGAWSRHKVRSGTGNDWMSREARFGEEPPRQGLETWISSSPSIVECAVQPIRHGSLSSKIQAAAADASDRMRTSARGAVGNHAAWDVDLIKGFSRRKLRRGLSPDMRRVLGKRRSVGSGVWRERSWILSGEGCSGSPASLWVHISRLSPRPLASDFFSGHPTTSSVNLLPSVPFATPSYNGLCQHGFRSLLSTSEHGRPAWEKAVCSVQPRCLRGQQRELQFHDPRAK